MNENLKDVIDKHVVVEGTHVTDIPQGSVLGCFFTVVLKPFHAKDPPKLYIIGRTQKQKDTICTLTKVHGLRQWELTRHMGLEH